MAVANRTDKYEVHYVPVATHTQVTRTDQLNIETWSLQNGRQSVLAGQMAFLLDQIGVIKKVVLQLVEANEAAIFQAQKHTTDCAICLDVFPLDVSNAVPSLVADSHVMAQRLVESPRSNQMVWVDGRDKGSVKG